jgi:hypothetical protein
MPAVGVAVAGRRTTFGRFWGFVLAMVFVLEKIVCSGSAAEGETRRAWSNGALLWRQRLSCLSDCRSRIDGRSFLLSAIYWCRSD